MFIDAEPSFDNTLTMRKASFIQKGIQKFGLIIEMTI